MLIGGCLIKSMHAHDLGNLSDAVVSDWDFMVKKLIASYPDIEIVIPGHGAFGGPELLSHTINLVEQYKNK